MNSAPLSLPGVGKVSAPSLAAPSLATRERPDDVAYALHRLKTLRDQVNRELARLVPSAGPLREPVAYVVNGGGQRFRAALLLLVREACGAGPHEAVGLAVAVEAVHLSSLVFDDLPCMDDSAVRRGRPALHARFGEATAVLVGIYLLSRAFEIAGRSPGAAAEVTRAIADQREGMLLGQLLDLQGVKTGETMRLKTGALFELSVRLGADVNARADERRQALFEYGRSLGTLYQLRDDILDGECSAARQAEVERGARAIAERLLLSAGRDGATTALAGLALHAARRSM